MDHLIDKGNCFEKSKIYLFKEFFFFHKCKFCIVWIWFIAKIILVSQKCLFCGYSKYWQIKESAPSLKEVNHQIFVV